MELKNIKKKVYKYNGVQKVKVEFDVIYENKRDGYDCKHLQEILEKQDWLLDHYVKWRSWDEYYTIDLFKDSLYNLGNSVYHGHFVSANKQGARAMLAADMLNKLYLDAPEDKSEANHISRFYTDWVRVNDTKYGMCRQLKFKYKHHNAMGMPPKEYETKMGDVIRNRMKKTSDANKDAVWKYIRKYIEYWWA